MIPRMLTEVKTAAGRPPASHQTNYDIYNLYMNAPFPVTFASCYCEKSPALINHCVALQTLCAIISISDVSQISLSA